MWSNGRVWSVWYSGRVWSVMSNESIESVWSDCRVHIRTHVRVYSDKQLLFPNFRKKNHDYAQYYYVWQIGYIPLVAY